MEQQRQAYKIQGVDEEEPANLKTLQEKKKKRKHNDVGIPLASFRFCLRGSRSNKILGINYRPETQETAC